MIKLKSLKIKNFLSFAGEHEFEFPDSGLYAIKGRKSNNQANSNGSGKTSFLEAIACALGYSQLPATELQNWHEDDAFVVALTMSLNDKELKIKRTPTAYEVVYEDLHLKSNEAKEFIKRTLLDTWLISFVTYRPQGVPGNFLSLSNADKMEFLFQLLELNKFEDLIEHSADMVKTLESTIVDLTNTIKRDEDSLGDTGKFIDLLKSSIESKTKLLNEKKLIKLVEPFKTSFTDANKVLEFTTKIKELSLRQSSNQELSKLLADRLMAVNKDVRQLTMDSVEIERKIGRTPSHILQHEVHELDIKIGAAENGVCDSCQQPFHDTRKIADLKSKRAIIDDKIHPLIGLEKKLIEIKADTEVKRANLEKMQIACNELQAKSGTKELMILENAYNAYIANCNSQYEKAFIQYQIELKHQTEDTIYLQKEIEENDAKIALYSQAQSALTSVVDTSKNIRSGHVERLALEKEILNALGKENFMRLVLEESLSLISNKANEILQAIPNTHNFSIQLDTESETKKGTVKKAIALKTYRNGVERALKSFSGGETCSINLAIDAAISEIISQRSGKAFGWLFLDEALDGMDSNSKIEAIETLRLVAGQKLIFLVDHSIDVNESLNGQFVIGSNDEQSFFGTS